MTEPKTPAKCDQKLAKNLLVNTAPVVRLLLDRYRTVGPTPEVDLLDELGYN